MGEDAAATLGGRYRIGELVASDPRRRVHDGYDLVLRRRVSLIRAEGVDPEATMPAPPAAALCPRPGVARVFDAGTWDGRLTFVTETVPAPSLADRLDRRRRCDRTTLLDVGTRVARVLASLHAQGVVHGALTPAQVLLTPEGPVLTEVGLAGALTRWTGTPPPARYRPPGRAAGTDEPAEPADDVYALGRILADVAPRRTRLGPAVDDLLSRMTRPDAAERPSVTAVADALAAARAPVAQHPRSRRRPPVALATAAAAAGLATASCVGAVLLAGAPAPQGARVAVPASAGPPAAPVVVPPGPRAPTRHATIPRLSVAPPAVVPFAVVPPDPTPWAPAEPDRPRDDGDATARSRDARDGNDDEHGEDRPSHGADDERSGNERSGNERSGNERSGDTRPDDRRSPEDRTGQDDA